MTGKARSVPRESKRAPVPLTENKIPPGELKRACHLKNSTPSGELKRDAGALTENRIPPGELKRDAVPLIKNKSGGGVETPSQAAEALYRQLWSRFGGRPWTYILRDIYHEAEWLVQTLFFAIGAAGAYHFPWYVLAAAWSLYTAGYVSGHLFWGTRWRPGQGSGQGRNSSVRPSKRTESS